MGPGQPILLLLRESRHQNFDVNSPDFKLLLQMSEKHHMGQIKQRPLLTTCVFRDVEVEMSCVFLHGLPAVPWAWPWDKVGLCTPAKLLVGCRVSYPALHLALG